MQISADIVDLLSYALCKLVERDSSGRLELRDQPLHLVACNLYDELGVDHGLSPFAHLLILIFSSRDMHTIY